MSPKEAALVVERFLTNSEAYQQEWNDFAETPQRNPVVERFRKRCDNLQASLNGPGNLDNATVEELKTIIRELRSLE